MNKRWINILLLMALALIVAIVAADYMSTRPGRRPENPHAFDTSEYEKTEAHLISHAEIRQIKIGAAHAQYLAFHGDQLLLLTPGRLQVLTIRGEETSSFSLASQTSCLASGPGNTITVAHQNYLACYSPEGDLVSRSQPLEGNTKFTAIAVSDREIFVADAGNRQVLVYDHNLNIIRSFSGESGVSDLHGLILPSAHFDLAVNPENELWVVNPGVHSLQNYAADGRFRRQWGTASFKLDGFSGCCNPSHIDFLPDGRFVTSEKGLVRIKIYKESGVLESVVAPPSLFKDGKKAPVIAAGDQDRIAALDLDKQLIRIFEPKISASTESHSSGQPD